MARMLTIQPAAPRRARVAAGAACALALALAALAWWLAPDGDAPGEPAAPARQAQPPQGFAPVQLTPAQTLARAALPASPFGAGPAAEEPEPPAEIRERNRAIDPARLTTRRPRLAEMLLGEMELRPEPRGGFVVREVAPGSTSARMGVQPGDLLFGFDAPANLAVDEGSMVALIEQKTIALDVVRAGRPLRLAVALDRDDAGPGDGRVGP